MFVLNYKKCFRFACARRLTTAIVANPCGALLRLNQSLLDQNFTKKIMKNFMRNRHQKGRFEGFFMKFFQVPGYPDPRQAAVTSFAEKIIRNALVKSCDKVMAKQLTNKKNKQLGVSLFAQMPPNIVQLSSLAG